MTFRASALHAERRKLLGRGAALASMFAVGCARHEEPTEAEVTPAEDLMQEHGVVERLVAVYDAAALRIEKGEQVDLAVVARAAALVRRFVEDYHERTEENFVFPRLRSAHREEKLVATLLQQHERGRQLTDEISRRASGSPGPELSRALRSFNHMYRAHAAREDTVVFPAFRSIVSGKEYRELGERFEEREQQLLGKRGFESAVTDVASLEAELGIADLAAYTP